MQNEQKKVFDHDGITVANAEKDWTLAAIK